MIIGWESIGAENVERLFVAFLVIFALIVLMFLMENN